MDINMLIYMIGALLITAITAGFVLWAFKTKQFEDNDHMKYACIEEDDEKE